MSDGSTTEKAKTSFPNFVKRLDIFGQNVPQLNIRGEAKINTLLGSLFSISILFLTIVFGILKLEDLVLRKNPSLSLSLQDLKDEGYD